MSEKLIVQAKYRPATVESHRGNPLIEALPDYLEWRPREILQRLAKSPEPITGGASRTQSTTWLHQLPSNLFVSTKRHYALFETIDLMIRQGYVLRNPLGQKHAEYVQDAYERLQSGEHVEGDVFENEVHEQLTASLFGTSGMGKTRTVERILTLYPQLIEHTRKSIGGPFLQITYIHVECPHDGSVIALCRGILAEVDRLTGADYRTKFRISDRTTLETLKSTLVHILAAHYVGIIVIDEIQNLVSSRKNREDLFNFIVSLSNSLNVPLLFVGTPKIYSFLSSNARTARRFGTRGCINWKPLCRDGHEWRTFVNELWKYSRLQQDPDEIPPEVEKRLFRYSYGIVEVLLKLYILTQARILMVSARPSGATESRMTPEALDHVFEEFFQNMRPILDKLHQGDQNALLKLEDIAMPESLEEATADMKFDSDDELSEADLRRRDLKETIEGGLDYAGEDLPPIAQEIGRSLIEAESKED